MGQKVIFLSYRRDDSPGYVKSLEKELEEYFGPGSVFRDVKDIAGGSKWKKVIEDNLRNSVVLLLIIGPRWDSIWRERIDDETNYIEYELNFAHDLNIPVIPVTLSGAQISDTTDLKSVTWLRENQVYDMSDKQGRWENDFKGLLELLENIRDIDKVRSRARPAASMSASVPASKGAKKFGKLKTAMAVVGVVFLALFVIGLFVPEEEPAAVSAPQTLMAPVTKPEPDAASDSVPQVPVKSTAGTAHYPDLTGTWRSQNYGTVYQVAQMSDGHINITGYANGEARFLENVPNKIAVELYGLGEGEFSVSNSSDRIAGSMHYYDGSVEYDTLVKIR